MKCHLYINLLDGASRRLGPYDICDEAQARRMADAELQRNPDVLAVDIWWDNGELYRIERPAAASTARVGAAWASAFGRGRSDLPTR